MNKRIKKKKLKKRMQTSGAALFYMMDLEERCKRREAEVFTIIDRFACLYSYEMLVYNPPTYSTPILPFDC